MWSGAVITFVATLVFVNLVSEVKRLCPSTSAQVSIGVVALLLAHSLGYPWALARRSATLDAQLSEAAVLVFLGLGASLLLEQVGRAVVALWGRRKARLVGRASR